jgi:hypothetical protein
MRTQSELLALWQQSKMLANDRQRSQITLTIVNDKDNGWTIWKDNRKLDNTFETQELARAFCMGYAASSIVLVAIHG